MPTPSQASLSAVVAGTVVGIATFAALVGAGLLLYQRLYGDSGPALVIILVIFGGLGAYLAWLVGVVVFSRVRAPAGQED